jgi:HEAT repeat protein
MDISIRCPHCGQVCAMKPEFVGRKVRCGQCKQIFNVMASGSGGGANEPITLQLAAGMSSQPAAPPAPARPAAPPPATFSPPPTPRASFAAKFHPSRRRPEARSGFSEQGFVWIGVVLLTLSILGLVLPKVGLQLKVFQRAGRATYGERASPEQMAQSAAVGAITMGFMAGVLMAIGLRKDWGQAVGAPLLAWTVLGITLAATWPFHGSLAGPGRVTPDLTLDDDFPPRPPSMQPRPGLPPGWPRNSMRPQPGQGAVAPAPIQLPPGASDPSHPDFYRVNLAELRSADAAHRMIAAGHLENAKPAQLRSEIVKALEETTHDSNSAVRAAGLKALCVWTTDDPVLVAIGALKDPDFLFRTAAVDVLTRHKDSRAIEPLIESLSCSPNWAAQDYLKHLGSAIEDAVLKHYDGGNEHAKEAILEILAEVATSQGIAKLREIAAGDDFMTASRARSALQRRGEKVDDLPLPGVGRVPPRAPPGRSAEGGGRRSPDQSALDPDTPAYYVSLSRQLQSGDFWQRSKAIDLLLAGSPGKADPETRKQIARAFAALTQTERGDGQKKAVRGLALWAGKYGVPTLLKLLNKENQFLHETVFEVLGPLQDPRAAVPVAELLGDFFDKEAARKCLRQMGPAAEEGLVKVLYSDDPQVSLAAVKLLGEVGTPKCLPTLRDGLRSTNLSIRAATTAAIRKINERERERKEGAEESDKGQSGSSSDDT